MSIGLNAVINATIICINNNKKNIYFFPLPLTYDVQESISYNTKATTPNTDGYGKSSAEDLIFLILDGHRIEVTENDTTAGTISVFNGLFRASYIPALRGEHFFSSMLSYY